MMALGKIPQQKNKLTKKRNYCQFKNPLESQTLNIVLPQSMPWPSSWRFLNSSIQFKKFIRKIQHKRRPTLYKRRPIPKPYCLGLLSQLYYWRVKTGRKWSDDQSRQESDYSPRNRWFNPVYNGQGLRRYHSRPLDSGGGVRLKTSLYSQRGL